MRNTLLALAVVLASTSAFAAGIYRWVDANGAVHYGDKVPEVHKDKAKPVSVTAASEVERAAAQARASRERSLVDSLKGEREVASKARVTTLTAPPPAAVSRKLTCEQEWLAFEVSGACFAPYRLVGGGIKVEAFNQCTDIPQPKCQKPPER